MVLLADTGVDSVKNIFILRTNITNVFARIQEKSHTTVGSQIVTNPLVLLRIEVYMNRAMVLKEK